MPNPIKKCLEAFRLLRRTEMLGRASKCKRWAWWAAMEFVQNKKYIYLKTQLSLDFKDFLKVGIEILKYLCNPVNQIRKYGLSSYSFQGLMMNMIKEKSRIGHVLRVLAHLICLKNSIKKNEQILCLRKKCL